MPCAVGAVLAVGEVDNCAREAARACTGCALFTSLTTHALAAALGVVDVCRVVMLQVLKLELKCCNLVEHDASTVGAADDRGQLPSGWPSIWPSTCVRHQVRLGARYYRYKRQMNVQ